MKSEGIVEEHSHATHEEVQKCWVSFGECWKNPGRTKPPKHCYSNKPHGTGARDGFNYGL